MRRLLVLPTIGEGQVRFLSRIKDLKARTKLAKRAAEEGWTVRATEKHVAKLLAKTENGPLNSRGKTAPSQQYEYNGFHCGLVGDEVVISGRNFKRTRDLVRQFVADYQSALECFLRDIDAASAARPTGAPTRSQDSAGASPGLALTDAAAPADVASPTLAADRMKQAAEVEAAAQPLKDLFSEIAKSVGSEGQALSDLLVLQQTQVLGMKLASMIALSRKKPICLFVAQPEGAERASLPSRQAPTSLNEPTGRAVGA